MQIVKQILALLSPDERARGSVLLGMVLVMGMLDAIGVASIMPFIAVLSNPALIESNSLLNILFEVSKTFGLATIDQFLFFLGLSVFVLFSLSLAFKAVTTYFQLRFSLMLEYSIGKRLAESYMNQPYSWFLTRNSADLGKAILSEVGGVISGAVNPVITFISQGFVVISIFALIIMIDPVLAIIVSCTLAAVYGSVFTVVRRYLTSIGKERVKANRERFTVLSEAFGAAKEVKVAGLEQVFIRRFSKPAETYANNQAVAQIIGNLPRFLIEGVAFGGILLVLLYLLAEEGGFVNAIPVVAVYAFAGYRLMPALQQVFVAATQLRFAKPALDALHADFINLTPERLLSDELPVTLDEAITLDCVEYTYPDASQLALNNLSLTIRAKSIVGFVGPTGSGKTTVVDLILGILEPQSGSLSVNGRVITGRDRSSWQSIIGYVPQQIYLSDDTVASNIAFGLDAKDINQADVVRAAKAANLHDFVWSELPERYQTVVGERGVRLSGGQRQRIGIARALYRKPQLLVFDEATSALDNLTEQAVMDAIQNLAGEITIILIAHRLSTVKGCDTIFMLERGEVVGQGKYSELKASNKKFQEMTRSLG